MVARARRPRRAVEHGGGLGLGGGRSPHDDDEDAGEDRAVAVPVQARDGAGGKLQREVVVTQAGRDEDCLGHMEGRLVARRGADLEALAQALAGAGRVAG